MALIQRQVKQELKAWYEPNDTGFNGEVRDRGWQMGPLCSLSVKSPGGAMGT